MATPESGHHLTRDNIVNGAAMSDISMAESTAPHENILEERPATPPVELLPPLASPIRSPVTPDERTEVNKTEDVDPATASLSNMLNDPVPQVVEPNENIYTHTQPEAQIESVRDDVVADPRSALLHESGPTLVQESTTVAGSRTGATTQALEAIPVQMANNEQGSVARIYINTKVTPVLLEGLKWVAKNEPDKPLKWLSEYLAKRSADVEGS